MSVSPATASTLSALTLLVSFPYDDVRIDVTVNEPRIVAAPNGASDSHQAVFDGWREQGGWLLKIRTLALRF